MSDHLPLSVLAAVRDVGLDGPEGEELRQRVQASLDHEIETELRDGRRDQLPRRDSRSGVLVLGLSVVASIVIAFGAITLLHGRGGGNGLSTASPKGLVARLAVLRRPQTAADVLPAHVKLVHSAGTIVPGLTRLVAVVPGAKMFLVVTTPSGGPGALWSPDLGDQASIVVVPSQRASQSLPIPAADLDDAQEVATLGDVRASGGRSGTAGSGYNVAVVPDGVARVRWVFTDAAGHPSPVQTAKLGDNVAYASQQPGAVALDRATWYAADGTVVPTSDSPLKRAITARQNAQRAQAIHEYARYSYHAPPALLADFAVFSITSRTGVRTPSGLTISKPPLSAVPYSIVNFSDPREPPQLDPSQIRQITMPSGISVWVIPGQRGLCLAALDQPVFPAHPSPIAGGAAEGCSANLAQAEATGAGFTSGRPGGPTMSYLVLPKSRNAITIHTGPRGRRTIHPPYGIYVGNRG